MISYDELEAELDQLRADRAAGMSKTARLLQMKLDALSENDHRSFDVRVAGPAALLVANAQKIDERQGTNRLTDKDALDELRLLRGTETYELARRFCEALRRPAIGQSCKNRS